MNMPDRHNDQRWMQWLCGLGAAWMLAAPAQAGPPRVGTVKLWANAVVVTAAVRLDDVAELSGFDEAAVAPLRELVLAPAPEPGGSRAIALSAVRDALTHAGVNRTHVIVKGAAECAVRRPAQPPPAPAGTARTVAAPAADAPATTPAPAGRTLREAVIAFFDQQLSAYGGRADVSFGRTAAQVLDLREPEFTFSLRRESDATLGLVHLEVTIRSGADEVQRVPMVVNVGMTRDVVAARKAINRGALVEAGDVCVVARSFNRTNDVGLTDPGEAIGMRAQRYVAPGETLAPADLERVPLVRNGQVVEVLARFGGVTVKSAAKAGQDGQYGEWVTLHMQGRRENRVTARVIGPQQVELGEGAAPDPPQPMLADGAKL